MLWTSLRFGWGNTGPVILLALLPMLTLLPGTAERQPARTEVNAQIAPAQDERSVTAENRDLAVAAR
jgi:hypothetical protein